MNYFAHGRRFLDRPYFLAGTAVPDWLNVINRRSRPRRAKTLVSDSDPYVAAIARGVLQHQLDDFRPTFLGHILVELLLDATLIQEDIEQLDRYYDVIEALDPQIVAHAVNRMVTQPAEGLDLFLPRFSEERFLYDYLEDGKLLWRLNQVMRRVKLPPLPDSLIAWFPVARDEVRRHATDLLTQPSTT